MHKKPRREIPCACGCGSIVITPDTKGQERRFLIGHHSRLVTPARLAGWAKKVGQTSWNKGQSYVIGDGRSYANRGSWMKAVRRFHGDSCMRCGWQEASCDAHHIIPRGHGGDHTLANGIVLCPNCHRLAHTKPEVQTSLADIKAKAVPLVDVA